MGPALIASAIMGFRAGVVGAPGWQVAVETAQVTARLVPYPAENSFYIYHTAVWTVLHQIIAVLLRAGLSEITTSLLISGLMGSVSFMALATIVFALSRDAWLSVGVVLVVFVSRAAEAGAIYPIWLLGTSHTYGVIGLSATVLAAALLGAGWRRSGALLLGLLPSIHPSLGAWLWLIIAVTAAWDWHSVRAEWLPAWKYFAAGCVLTGVSLVLQFALHPRPPAVDAVLAAKILDSFIQHDGHRAPVPLRSLGLPINMIVLGVAWMWLRAFRQGLPTATTLLLRILVVSAGVSLVLAGVTWLPVAWVPEPLLVLMPGRLLNFNAFLLVAFLLGLIGSFGDHPVARGLTVLVSVGLLAGPRSQLWEWGGLSAPAGGTHRLQAMLVLGVACAWLAWTVWTRRGAASGLEDVTSVAPKPLIRGSASAMGARIASLAIFGLLGVATWRHTPTVPEALLDRTNDALFAAIARGSGMVVVGGDIPYIQLRTRRPVLINNSGLDGLPYSAAGGPHMARVLMDVYGIDLLAPRDEPMSVVPSVPNRHLWEQFSAEKWRSIKRTYHVTQVVTYEDWTLNLPLIADNGEYRLFEIPDDGPR
jgi:hypothetical protein